MGRSSRPVSRRGAAVSLAISLAWHGVILAVLGLAVHPFALPREPPPVDVELLPPLTEAPPPPPPQKAPQPKPVLDDPLEILRKPEPALPKPQVIQQKAVAEPKLVNDVRVPEPVPPAPTESAKAAPALAQPLQLDRRNPAPPKLQAQRLAVPDITPAPAPAAPQAEAQTAPKTEAPPRSSAPVQVLTNEQVVRAPVEIKPPARTQMGPRNTSLPTDQLPPPGGAGAQEAAGGAGGGGGANAALDKPSIGPINGYDAKGVRTGPHMLGCYTPEAYLTSAEKAACAQQMAERGKNALNLGLNIDPAKLSEYDRNRACHANTINASPGRSNEASADTSIKGLGANPRLRDCGPGDR